MGIVGGALVLSLSPLAVADKGPGEGRIGLVSGGRMNLGSLGSNYRGGMLFGVEAGYQPYRQDSDWSLGLSSTTLVRGYYFASKDSLVDRSIELTEFSFGARLRRSLGEKPRFLIATAGAMYSASSVPLPPDHGRTNVGPYAGLGYEMRVIGAAYLAFEGRYSMFLGGPESVSMFVSLTAGLGSQ